MIFLDNVELYLAEKPRLFELARDQIGRERRGIERHAQFARKIRHGADVVLVRVGQDNAQKVPRALLDEVEIREHQIDAGIFTARKGHAEVNHQPFAFAAVEIDVHANLARSAERKEQQFLFGSVILLHVILFVKMVRLIRSPVWREWQALR